ncbi:MAG: hypothetical protein KDA80_24490, partial [Planctomycetaceae bacterium]|nr:hypothetical protein [Planctomycetaceae bacterium]
VVSSIATAGEPCRIDIVDRDSGWPVPLVELRTTNQLRFVSDNAGRIAFDALELMDQPVWFTVYGHGYSVPADGFGYRGVRLQPTVGGHLTVSVKRTLPAKRLGRITGSGLFAESQQLGLETDWQDQGILGCDSVQNAVHNGRLYWGWGDTTLAKYPLGLFHMLGATTEIRPLDSFEPPVRLRYDYFVGKDRRPRVVAKMPGDGPTWLSGYASLPDDTGVSRLVACYFKIQPPLSVYETGLCVWNEETENFERHRVVWSKATAGGHPPLMPDGHGVRWIDDEGREWLLFGDPFPRLKIPVTFHAWEDPTRWETLTPQRDVPSADGKLSVRPHRGSIAWNAYRGKWVAIFTQYGGDSSFLGEIWYAEAPSPVGPWEKAVKVVTHDNYTFYNPKIHSEMTSAEAPFFLFEGTYTAEFAKQPEPTPRYNYNQILYRLDFDEVDRVLTSMSD